MGRGQAETQDGFSAVLGLRRGHNKQTAEKIAIEERLQATKELLGPNADLVMGVTMMIDDIISSPRLIKQANLFAAKDAEDKKWTNTFARKQAEEAGRQIEANHAMLLVQRKLESAGYNISPSLVQVSQRCALGMSLEDLLAPANFKKLTEGFNSVYKELFPEKVKELIQ